MFESRNFIGGYIKKLYEVLATVFGAGYFPKSPGTFGTFVALVTYYFLPNYFFGYNMDMFQIYLLFILIMLSVVSVHICSQAEKTMGHDDGKIVIDEYFGYFFSILFLPKTTLILILSFIIFRFYDIVKPPPIYQIQKLNAGWGIMIDDVLAGIFTNVTIRIILIILPLFLS
ncbi:MAG: phosphatidylglycerophosphatase A [Candidatus Cloacimonadota bacterium]|nr:phosphatidylglycerophosphatase A [Candidatus Cloacimonadota bacterium]